MTGPGVLIGIALAALFAAAVLYIAGIFQPSRRMSLAAHGLTLAAWLLLTLDLVIRLMQDGVPALSTGMQALVAIAALVLLVHLAQALWKDLPAFGAAAVPLALVALFMATALPSPAGSAPDDALASHWLYLHILSIVISMVLLLLAAVCAVLWLLQHNLLKKKRWAGAFRRLPPLELLDGLSYLLAAVGFAALSLGFGTAIIWAATHPESPEISNQLTRATALLSWLLYAFYLWAHTRPGWRGRRAHYILVAGCIAILVTTSFHRFFMGGAGSAEGAWLIPGLLDSFTMAGGRQ